MQSIWTGAITLSKLQMPVRLGSSSRDNEMGLHLVRKADGSKIRFTRVAAADGKEVAWADTAKGYDAPDGSVVILEDDDFKEAFGPKNRVAELVMFTDGDSIPRTAADKSYLCQPDRGGEGAYALLASTLQRTGKVGIVTFAMRQRVSMAVLRAEEGYLYLEKLKWHSDMLQPDFKAPESTASEEEQALALKLVESMSGKFDYEGSVDTSAEALNAIIQAKIEKGDVIAAPKGSDNGGSAALMTLMDGLQASLQATVPEQAPPTARKRSPRKAS